MNIGFITSEYPHPKIKHAAGIGTSIKNLSIALVKKNVQVIVFVYHQDSNDVFTDEGVEIHLIKSKRFKFATWYFYRKHIQNYVNSLVSQKNIELLEAPDWTGITAFMNFQIPLIIRLHGSDAYFCKLERRKQKWKNYFFEKYALKSADRIVSVSNFTAEVTKKLFHLKSDIETIYNGVNTKIFIPIDVTINNGQILYFGTIIRKKGVLELAKIFNNVINVYDNASLILIGKDVKDIFEKKSTLQLFAECLTEKARNKFTHIEEVPYKEIKNYIAKAQVVVLPSFAEAFPMTWLETLAMEKALVASDIGWAKELMKNGQTGYLENPFNHKEFSKKIITLLKDKRKNEYFGKNGRLHIVSNFSTSVIIENNINLYKSLIS